MANYYVSSVKHAALTGWVLTTAKSVGNLIRGVTGTGARRVFRCTTAGTTGGSEPAWNTTNGATTNDGSVVWTQVGGLEVVTGAGAWANPLPTIADATTVFSVNSNTDFIYVDHLHNEISAAAALTMITDTVIACVNSAGSVPPVEADWQTGAKVSVQNHFNNLTIKASYVYGVEFVAGTAANEILTMEFRPEYFQIFEKCKFTFLSTYSGGIMNLGGGSLDGSGEFIDCTFKFGNTAQCLAPLSGSWLFRDSATFHDTGGSMPVTYFQGGSGKTARCNVRACDLSAISGNLASGALFTFEDCKLHASVTITGSSPTFDEHSEMAIRVHNCDDTGNNRDYRMTEKGVYANLDAITIGPTDGANDGVNQLTWRLEVKSNVRKYLLARTPRIAKRYNTTGASKTFTINAAYSFATALTAGDLWAEFEILDSSASPKGKTYQTRVTPVDATALSTTSVDWTLGASARANSTLYATAALFKVASNPTRLFFVVSGGTSAGSEPGGYATAVDGSTITDGSASVIALRRIGLAVTATPGRKGVIKARVLTQKLGSFYIYVDPKIRIT